MGHPLILFILVIKSYLQNMKKIEKSLGGAIGQWTFVHKVNGIYGPFFFTTQKSQVNFPRLHQKLVVVVLRSPIHANETSEYNGMLYRTSNRVLNNGIKVIILICMDGTSQYHHHPPKN